jgi:hypothetical protein
MTGQVRAKLRLTEITDVAWSAARKKLRFECQYDNTIPENQRFQQATPEGHIELVVDNPAAINALKLGNYYYVDFTSANAS